MRGAIVFELVPTGDPAAELAESSNVKHLLEVLGNKALAATQLMQHASPAEARRMVYQRSADVRDYVLARANGTCEARGRSAPFITKSGRPYLEPHHIRFGRRECKRPHAKGYVTPARFHATGSTTGIRTTLWGGLDR